MGDPVGVPDDVGVRPGRLVGDQAAPLSAGPRRRGIEQLLSAVELLRVPQLRQLEDQLRPLLTRREVIPDKGVDVGGVWDRRCLSSRPTLPRSRDGRQETVIALERRGVDGRGDAEGDRQARRRVRRRSVDDVQGDPGDRVDAAETLLDLFEADGHMTLCGHRHLRAADPGHGQNPIPLTNSRRCRSDPTTRRRRVQRSLRMFCKGRPCAGG